ncbi:MAG: hypothetical protein WB660_30925 [Candidatus Sulfotelmatobacter sp.]
MSHHNCRRHKDTEWTFAVVQHNVGNAGWLFPRVTQIYVALFADDLAGFDIERQFTGLQQWSIRELRRQGEMIGNYIAGMLCQEDEKSSCCTKDEGRSFGVAL